MKTLLRLWLPFATVVSASAGPNETAIIAAMSLAEASSYRWTSTLTDAEGTYELRGETQRGGYTRLKMPMLRSLAQRLGREAETDFELVTCGAQTGVFRAGDHWKSVAELPRREHQMEPFSPTANRPRRGLGIFGQPMPVPVGADGRQFDEAELSARVGLHVRVSHPHEELAIIVSSHDTLECEGGVATGRLSELGAQLLLVRDGQRDVEPLSAAGTFKLWLQDGAVVRYQLRLEGVLQIPRGKLEVHRMSETQVRDVGSARFEVPAEAHDKLMQQSVVLRG